MKRHNLKIMLDRFEDIKEGSKLFEIRYNDRDYQVGDILVLHPINDDGKFLHGFGFSPIEVDVIYIDDFEQKNNYVVLGISW